jgi:hypothetical protein
MATETPVGRAGESITGQGGHNNIEVLEHRQHVEVIEESARPPVREDNRHPSTLVHEVDAASSEVIESSQAAAPRQANESYSLNRRRDAATEVRKMLPPYPGTSSGHLVRRSRARKSSSICSAM